MATRRGTRSNPKAPIPKREGAGKKSGPQAVPIPWSQRNPKPFDHDARVRFLELVEATGLLTWPMRHLGFPRLALEEARLEDPSFAAAVEDAIEVYKDSLRMDLEQRALNGVDYPMVVDGEPVYVTKFETALYKLHATVRLEELRPANGVKLTANTIDRLLVVPARSEADPEDWVDEVNGGS